MKLMRRVRMWAGRIGLRHTARLWPGDGGAGLGVATYLALTGAPPFGPHPNAVLSLLNLDLVLLLALGALIAKRLVQVWAERRRGLAGSRLQIRLVVLFSLIAVTADDHRRGVLVSVLQLRRRILVQRQGAHGDLRIAGRRRSLSARASAGDSRRCAGDGQRSQSRRRRARRSTRGAWSRWCRRRRRCAG